MNAGLGNLFSLKTHLLGLALADDEVRMDQVIIDIGEGVASQMESICDRKFARVVGDQFICMADRASVILPRYPVEAITLIEYKPDQQSGWQASGPGEPVVEGFNPKSGVVYLQDNVDAGPYYAQIRLTFTGGFFFETAEPGPGYPTPLPAVATPLPPDLRLAWLTQCRRVWDAFDKLGAKITDNSAAAQAALETLDWSPAALSLLQPYRRLQLV